MAQEFRVKSFAELERLVRGHARQRDERVRIGIRKAAREGRNFVARETVPEAFGELRKALHVVDTRTGAVIVADAPHAAAVEVGSRPHTPPLAPLVAWVKLRGMHGLSKAGKPISNRTRGGAMRDPNREAARVVAGQLAGMAKSGAIDIDAPTQIARAIQHAISVNGTKPSWYMRRGLPEVRRALDQFVPAELAKPLGQDVPPRGGGPGSSRAPGRSALRLQAVRSPSQAARPAMHVTPPSAARGEAKGLRSRRAHDRRGPSRSNALHAEI